MNSSLYFADPPESVVKAKDTSVSEELVKDVLLSQPSNALKDSQPTEIAPVKDSI